MHIAMKIKIKKKAILNTHIDAHLKGERYLFPVLSLTRKKPLNSTRINFSVNFNRICLKYSCEP